MHEGIPISNFPANILIAGLPGTGRSSLAALTAAHLTSTGREVWYLQAEEEPRMQRWLRASKVRLMEEDSALAVLSPTVWAEGRIVVIDNLFMLSGNLNIVSFAGDLQGLARKSKATVIVTMQLKHDRAEVLHGPWGRFTEQWLTRRTGDGMSARCVSGAHEGRDVGFTNPLLLEPFAQQQVSKSPGVPFWSRLVHRGTTCVT